jgi:hypothetical protein
MTHRFWVLLLLANCLLLTATAACSKEPSPATTAVSTATPLPSPQEKLLTATPTELPPSPTRTPTPIPATPPPTPSATVAGPAVTDVQFALDLDETGQLIYPATEFVFGITRVYVRFAYQELADVTQIRSVWYLNNNPVISDTLNWDGGDAGQYIIWMEDPNGVGRGEWRWELTAINGAQDAVDSAPLGGGRFTISGEPRYVNTGWGLSLDPPVNWKTVSEAEGFVTFSSPDQRAALALRVTPATAGLRETAAADLALFQADHPDVEVAATRAVTMGGEEAILQKMHYTDQENGEQLLYVVSALHASSAYTLWMLGPAEYDATLQALLVTTLRSIRFSAD